ncbi:putative RNA-binding protein [Toxoplasma gondii GAB2-2007-GAL-DOM2]|uniref:Putative RNA-binding protein n=1 Tax=Toxoplasma gondii GAB2-2007-GAL-DOM2 TaxID=1130820 RepID=A0A086JFC7_TOXGO|nr:putative RNA-binding protein [Toxoplasma gondii GAB2-2007-GAL-DOM2]
MRSFAVASLSFRRLRPQAWLRQKLQDRVLGMEEVYNDEELRMDLQKRLLEVTFVQSGVLPLLFQSVILGRSRESSVSLLCAVVHHAHPGKALSVFREEISAACLPWLSRLSDLLYMSLPKSRGTHASGKVNSPPRRLGCRVVELLELFRGIVELSPASALPRVSLRVWRRLTDCFFVYTQNTIFMSKCLPVFKKVRSLFNQKTRRF